MARRANVDAWLQFFKTLQFDPRVAELWASHARPCIRLNPGETRDADDLAPRLSKLGGEPDLPVGMGWPERPPYQNPEQAKFHEVALEEYPLVFIAQINLKDVAVAGCDLPLPASGLLMSWSWGDRGMIYFMCRESDIAAKRFDRVWVVLQCL